MINRIQRAEPLNLFGVANAVLDSPILEMRIRFGIMVTDETAQVGRRKIAETVQPMSPRIKKGSRVVVYNF
jgi:hypothetical protein